VQTTTDQPRLTPLRAASAGLRFLLELAALAAVAYWGVAVGDGLLQQVALAAGAVVLLTGVWGLFVAPKAVRRLGDPLRLVVELVVFGVAVGALVSVGEVVVGVVFGLLVVVSEVAVWLLGQRDEL
jgi:membrane protein YdbS with pleckstrin-like domain